MKYYFFGKTDPYNATKYKSKTGGETHFFIKSIEGTIEDAENTMMDWAENEGDDLSQENDESIADWKSQLDEDDKIDFSWYEGEGVYHVQCGYDCVYKRGETSYNHDVWQYQFKTEDELTDDEKELVKNA